MVHQRMPSAANAGLHYCITDSHLVLMPLLQLVVNITGTESQDASGGGSSQQASSAAAFRGIAFRGNASVGLTLACSARCWSGGMAEMQSMAVCRRS